VPRPSHSSCFSTEFFVCCKREKRWSQVEYPVISNRLVIFTGRKYVSDIRENTYKLDGGGLIFDGKQCSSPRPGSSVLPSNVNREIATRRQYSEEVKMTAHLQLMQKLNCMEIYLHFLIRLCA
jgi:hypothetical protein